jgi:hypothetical protein
MISLFFMIQPIISIDNESTILSSNAFHDYFLITLQDYYKHKNSFSLSTNLGYSTIFNSSDPYDVLKVGELLNNDFKCFFDILNTDTDNAIVVFFGETKSVVNVLFYKNYYRKGNKVDKNKLQFQFRYMVNITLLSTINFLEMVYSHLEEDIILTEVQTQLVNLN